jgi:5-formyltetrahydrofolate cyclo-ligase
MNPISKIELRRLMRQKRSALPPAEAFAAADHLTTQAMRILKRQPLCTDLWRD